MRDFPLPAVLKSVRLGYDGKGQTLVDADMPAAEPGNGWGCSSILEGFVDFSCEISVSSRAPDGAMALYPPVENRHVNHILDTTIAPACIAPETTTQADKRTPHRRTARPGRRVGG